MPNHSPTSTVKTSIAPKRVSSKMLWRFLWARLVLWLLGLALIEDPIRKVTRVHFSVLTWS
jgi:hypothetical protein